MSSAIDRGRQTTGATTADDAASEVLTDPLQVLRRTLRGRYPIVLTLAVLLGVLGSIGGYNAIAPSYESTGLLRVESTLPSILYDTRENRVPPNFDAYVAAQASIAQSRQVLDAAAADAALRDAGWPVGDAGVAQLQSALSVERRRGEQVISLTVTHPDPALARTAVNTVIRAFKRHLDEPQTTSPAMLQTLTEREASLELAIRTLRQEQLEESNQYGPDAIDRMHANKVQELIEIDQKLAELGLAMEASNDRPATPTIRAARIDPVADLREQKHALEAEIASRRADYGPKHPLIRELMRRVEAIDIRMQLREQTLVMDGPAVSTTSPARLADVSREQLARLQVRYNLMRTRVRAEASDLGRQKAMLAGLNEELAETTALLHQTRQRLDELRVEGAPEDAQRVRVIAWGEQAVVPVTDRRAGLAAAGTIMGMSLAVGIVFVIGLVDPRCRYVDELVALPSAPTVLGCLPDIGGRQVQRSDAAALAVHQLRNLLELREDGRSGGTYAVTSATQGEGKTSLSLALASSFAIAGRRTLIIDTDLVHAGLTSELDLRGRRGLWQAVADSAGGGEIHPTMRMNLWAMPVGSADGGQPTDLSFDRLCWVIDQVRSQFDVIVIDTGSLLSSLEAALIAAAADEVLLVVARQRSTRLVQAALQVLDQIGASCDGLVFNRASAADLYLNQRLATGQRGAAAPFVRSPPATSGGHASAVAARIGPDATDTEHVTRQAA